MVNDPFADPMTQTAQGILQHVGIKTAYSKIYPAENPDYKAGAGQVAASGAQLVVMGTVDAPTVSAFITAFQRRSSRRSAPRTPPGSSSRTAGTPGCRTR
jgi:hypothetical protein